MSKWYSVSVTKHSNILVEVEEDVSEDDMSDEISDLLMGDFTEFTVEYEVSLDKLEDEKRFADEVFDLE